MTHAIDPRQLRRLIVEHGSIQAAAEALGVNERTITRRARSSRVFAEAIREGLEEYRRMTYPHGTESGYRRGCRCDLCREAHTNHSSILRYERMGRVPDGIHGKASTYTNWMCRCGPCKAAHSINLKQRKAKP